MTDSDAPTGQRFSHVYIERGQPLRDSARFRRRLAGYFDEHLAEYGVNVASLIHTEHGVDMPVAGYGYSFRRFFAEAEIRDVLDSVTTIRNYLTRKGTPTAEKWLGFVGRTLREENVGYRVDEAGGDLLP